jgi:DNA-binding NtrC family response regulator
MALDKTIVTDWSEESLRRLAAGSRTYVDKGNIMPSRVKLPPMVLVVEDDHSMRELCTRALERVGIQVICCDTSMKASNYMHLHGHRIACILADVVLGAPTFKGRNPTYEGNGARLLSLLKYVSPSAVAVQMSAYSVSELSSMGYKVEVPHFLRKPFTPEKLRAMVTQLLPHLNIPRVLTLPADEVVWDL